MIKSKKLLGLVLALIIAVCGSTTVAFASSTVDGYTPETLDKLGTVLIDANQKGDEAYTKEYLQNFAKTVYRDIVPTILVPGYMPYLEPYFWPAYCLEYCPELYAGAIDPDDTTTFELAYWQTFDFTQLTFESCGQEGTKEFFINGIEQLFRMFWLESDFRLLDGENGEAGIVNLWLVPLLESNGIACSFDSAAVQARFSELKEQDYEIGFQTSHMATIYMASVMVDLIMG